MANKESSIPEWEIFKRLEKLEMVSANTKTLLQDTFTFARMALTLIFLKAITERPDRAIALKDALVGSAKRSGVSKEGSKFLEDLLLELCKEVEK